LHFGHGHDPTHGVPVSSTHEVKQTSLCTPETEIYDNIAK